MNILENAFNELELKRLTFNSIKTHMVLISDVKEILQDVEVAIRNECDCEQLKQEIDETKL